MDGSTNALKKSPVAYASNHAVVRMAQRYGIELDGETWATILSNAAAGLYPWIEGAIHVTGDTRVYAVPMGPSEDAVTWVPMVVNTYTWKVVTVLETFPNTTHWQTPSVAA